MPSAINHETTSDDFFSTGKIELYFGPDKLRELLSIQLYDGFCMKDNWMSYCNTSTANLPRI
jgi:hypothetical protein